MSAENFQIFKIAARNREVFCFPPTSMRVSRISHRQYLVC